MARVILLSGPKFSGKSRFVERLARELREAGVRVSGFFQRGVFDGAGNKIGYDLVDVAAGATRPLARISGARDAWVFDDAAFADAAANLDSEAELVIVDEAGPLELSGRGHRQTLERALDGRGPILLVVREELEESFRAMLATRAGTAHVRYLPQSAGETSERIRELLALAGS
ncbi:MAG TPA: nucleoside-triphosphatase [Polyangia bacterium]|nr:nucleoside-triphosphatase [Polyangia bacterium]